MADVKWKVSVEPDEKEITYQGQTFKLMVRPLTWSKRNQIISQCLSYTDKGEAQFNLDKYYKEALVYMVPEGPWGKTDPIFLTSITEELGKILQGFVSNPFDKSGEEQKSFFEGEPNRSLAEEAV